MAPRSFTNWREAITVYRHPRVITMLFLGFSAGLPYLLIFSTLTAWLRDEKISLATIGLFSWVGISFSIKLFWAPFVDRLRLPLLTRWLGQRRSWMLFAQTGIVFGLAGLATTDPKLHLEWVVYFALLVAFASATQDISIDAYRIEAASKEKQGAMAASYIFGYRLALLVAGAGALYIADFSTWTMAYVSMAVLMGVGMITVMIIREPEHIRHRDAELLESHLGKFIARTRLPQELKRFTAWILGAVVAPFVEFFERNRWMALVVLLFIAVYRISDITMGIMANPFYLDLGFTKTQIASVAKIFGFFMTIAGSMLGGLLVVRFGIMRPLLLGAVMVASTNLLFAYMAHNGPDLTLLKIVISADNISGGLANAVFIAYLSSLTNTAYTATQYALFSSLMTLPGKVIAGFSGFVIEASNYATFFIYAAAVGIPAILLVLYLMRRLNVDAAEP